MRQIFLDRILKIPSGVFFRNENNILKKGTVKFKLKSGDTHSIGWV